MSQMIYEAFQELEGLDDLENNIIADNATFTLDRKGMKDLGDYLKADKTAKKQDTTVTVTDPDVYSDEDLKKSYKGDVLCRCEVCGGYIVKNIDELDLDPKTEMVNVEEECPYCYNKYGFKIVGEIGAKETEPDQDLYPDFGDEYTDGTGYDDDFDERANSAFFNNSLAQPEMSAIYKLYKDKDGEYSKEDSSAVYDEDSIEYLDDFGNGKTRLKRQTEALDTLLLRDSDTNKTVEVDMSAEDSVGVTVRKDEEDSGTRISIQTSDDFEADNDTSGIDMNYYGAEEEEEGEEETGEEEYEEEGEEGEEGEEEEVEEVSDETLDILNTKEEEAEEEEAEEEEEEGISEVEEESFSRLGKNYLKKIYENVKDYKTTACYSTTDGKLIIEGLIKFTSGKVSPTSFMFSPYKKGKNSNKCRFLGENLQISRNKKAFILAGSVNHKKFLPESLTYDYYQKDAETGRGARLYGTVKTK